MKWIWSGAMLLLLIISSTACTTTIVPPTPDASSATGTPIAEDMPAAFQPLNEAACEDLAGTVTQTLGMTATVTATAPFQDYLTGQSGAGCQITVAGTGHDFASPIAVVDALQSALAGEGWEIDSQYLADGPTGTATALRKEQALCLLSAGWDPAPEANCPDDQPISACELSPEQQIYQIVLNCAEESS